MQNEANELAKKVSAGGTENDLKALDALIARVEGIKRRVCESRICGINRATEVTSSPTFMSPPASKPRMYYGSALT